MNRIIAFIAVFITTVESKDFCQSFNANNQRISFGYRHNKPRTESELYLVIDQSYWKLEFRDHPKDKYKTIIFASNDSKYSDWFGNEYRMAFNVADGDDGYTTALIPKIGRTVYLGKFFESDLSSSRCTGALQIQFKRFKPSIAYTLDSQINGKQIVCFLEQTNELTKNFKRRIICYELSPNLNTITEVNSSTELMMRIGAIDDLEPDLKVIALFSQFSEKVHKIVDKSRGNGFIILFQDKYAIKYCYTWDQELSSGCEKNRLKTLMDCKPTVRGFGPLADYRYLMSNYPNFFYYLHQLICIFSICLMSYFLYRYVWPKTNIYINLHFAINLPIQRWFE